MTRPYPEIVLEVEQPDTESSHLLIGSSIADGKDWYREREIKGWTDLHPCVFKAPLYNAQKVRVEVNDLCSFFLGCCCRGHNFATEQKSQ